MGNVAKTSKVWAYVDICFVGLFALELTLRILSEGRAFFTGEAWVWNLFDFIITFISVLEHVLSSVERDAAFMRISHIRVMRVIRVVRLMRVLRLVRVVKFV